MDQNAQPNPNQANPNQAPRTEANPVVQPDAAPVPAPAETPQAGPGGPPPSGALPQIPVIPAVPTASGAAPADPAMPYGPNPVIADDVDVIEKEWVEQAERIIKSNAHDPHAEEEAVENLQIDYMKKRYNKDIKKSNE